MNLNLAPGSRARDMALAVSLVNLLFLRHWIHDLTVTELYGRGDPVAPTVPLSLIALQTLASALAFGILRASRHPKAARLLVPVQVVGVGLALVGFFWMFDAVRLHTGASSDWSEPVVAFVAAPLLVLGMAGAARLPRLARHRRLPLSALAVGLLIMAPLAPMLIAQGALQAAQYDGAAAAYHPPLAPRLPADPDRPRLAILLFDELDQDLLVGHRPADLHLPAFDAISAESVVATNAYAPEVLTLRSVPAMLAGQRVHGAIPSAHDELGLYLEDGRDTLWSTEPNLFSDLRTRGANVAVSGFFHPYCRLFEAHLVSCTGHGLEDPNEGWTAALDDHIDHLVAWTLPGSGIEDRLRDAFHRDDAELDRYQRAWADAHRTLMASSLQQVSDPTLDVVFIHLNAPHPIGTLAGTRGLWDPLAETYRTGPGGDYYDDLLLADRSLAQIREALVAAGTWNDTTLVVTSDHGHRGATWRPPHTDPDRLALLTQPTDHNVPLIVKPRGGADGRVVNVTLETTLLRALGNAVADGTLPDADAVEAWLTAQATDRPRPEYWLR